MLRVFYGSDRRAVRDAAQKIIDTHFEGVETVSLDDDNYVTGAVVDAATSESLFGGTQLYVLDTPSKNAEFNSEVLENLEVLASSNHTYVLLEGTLLAPQKKKYAKFAETLEELAADKTERFNSFALAEALATKNKKMLFVLLHEAKMSGLRDEEIMGMLWWQLKALRLAELTQTAEESGMKDYPYKKAKQALRQFSKGEVRQLMHSFLAVYHDGHKGIRDLDIALEEWVLTL